MKRDTSSLDDFIRSEQAVWATRDSLEFYITHRTRPEELYESERFFLPQVLQGVSTCLDVGCAAGGFSRIMKSLNPTLRYTGIDIIPEFVDIARRAYPDSEFYVSDGVQLPFASGSFELVYSTGLLHVNSRYRDIVRACYEVTLRYLLCDFRLTHGPTVVGEIDVNFGGNSSARQPLPYIVLNTGEHLDFLKTLQPRPLAIRARGYFSPPSPTARVPLDKIMMAFFLIEKGSGHDSLTIELDLPE